MEMKTIVCVYLDFGIIQKISYYNFQLKITPNNSWDNKTKGRSGILIE